MSAHVQSTGAAQSNAGTTYQLTLSGVTAGSVLVVAAKLTLANGSTAITGVADNQNSGSYDQRVNQLNTGGTQRLYVYTKTNVVAGSTTVTITVNQTGLSIRWIFAEYSGVDVSNIFDSSVVAAAFASGTTITTSGITTGAANAQAISVISTDSSATAIAPGTGETERQEISNRVQLQDEQVASPGAYTASWTLTAAQAGVYAIFALRNATASPNVTDVDTDNIVTATQTNVVITGTAFGASGGTVDLIDGSTVVAQSVDSWSATSIQIDMVLGGCRYGALTLRVTTSGGLTATKSITVNPPSGTTYVNTTTLRSLAFDAKNCPTRVYDTPTDIPNGAQVRVVRTGGSGNAAADQDGRLAADDTVTQIELGYNSGSGWDDDPWDLRGPFPEFIGPNVVSRTYQISTAIATLAIGALFTDPDDTTGTYSVTPALPTGLSLNTTTGDITGTPSGSAGTTTHTVRRTDPLGSYAESDTFSITIDAAPVIPVYIPPIVAPDGFKGIAYSFDFSTRFTFGTTYGLTNQAGLPSGVTFNSGTGVISGTPTVTGTFGPFTPSATNTDGTTSGDAFSFDVNEQNVIMPDVVGDLIAAATTELTGLGLLVATSNVASSRPIGEVLEQSVPKDATIIVGTTVLLSVAADASTIQVPGGIPRRRRLYVQTDDDMVEVQSEGDAEELLKRRKPRDADWDEPLYGDEYDEPDEEEEDY